MGAPRGHREIKGLDVARGVHYGLGMNTKTPYTVKALYVCAADKTAATVHEASAIGRASGFSFAVYDAAGEMVGSWCPIGGRSRGLIDAMEAELLAVDFG